MRTVTEEYLDVPEFLRKIDQNTGRFVPPPLRPVPAPDSLDPMPELTLVVPDEADLKTGDCDHCGRWSSSLLQGVCDVCDAPPPQPLTAAAPVPTGQHMLETASGAFVDLANPDPASIHIKDIAHALARVNRFGGHTSGHCGYSVAQHSLWVSDYLLAAMEHEHGAPDPRLALHGLLHDAAEAYLGDVSAPLKALLGGTYARLETQMQAAIYAALGLAEPSPEMLAEIKTADRQALMVEAEARCASRGRHPHWFGGRVLAVDAIADHTVRANNPAADMDPVTAESLFCLAYHRLRKGVRA